MIQGRIIKVVFALATFGVLGVAQSATQDSVPGEYLVKMKSSAQMNSALTANTLGAELTRVVVQDHNLILVKRNILETQDFAIERLSQNPNVVFAEPNYIYRINLTPNDPKLEDLWGLKNSAQKGGRVGIDIGAEAVWDIETGSRDVIVAVIDTGIDYSHPDLIDNVWTNDAELNGKAGVDDDGNGYVDDIYGYDFSNNDGDPMDDHGHGTHVSGTIGAKGNDGKGIVGVNWNVRIMGVKFLSGSGSGTLEGAVRAIHYATKMGAMIESNSWGGGGFTQALFDVIKEAEQKDILFVAAAGNETNDNDVDPSYPATYDVPNVVSVAAIDNSGALASFSSYGKKTVHVAAPGVDVTSALPKKLFPEGYGTWSGTSMATPHISGIAALMKAHNNAITYAQIKESLIAGTIKLSGIRTKTVSGGVTNAYYALTGETPPVDMEDPFNWASQAYQLSSEHPYKENFSAEYVVNVPGANQISVYFDKFQTERGYDFVEFFDKNNVSVGKWSGMHSGEFTPAVTGDTLRMVFTTDGSAQDHGFDVSKVAFR